jgi:hypothetical protein
MAFGSTPFDGSTTPIPIGCVYVPGVGFKALQGGTLLTDASSNDSSPARMELVGASKNTYAAAATGLALAATPTNIATLTGSASKVVKLVKLGLTLSCTALGVTSLDALLQKFSSALTGGTPVALTMTPMDAGPGVAATALAQNWTANSTGGGALVGNLCAQKIMPQWAGPATATDFPQQMMPQVVWDFNGVGGPPTLRSASQVLSVNLNGGTLIATTTFAVFMIWTEE